MSKQLKISNEEEENDGTSQSSLFRCLFMPCGADQIRASQGFKDVDKKLNNIKALVTLDNESTNTILYPPEKEVVNNALALIPTSVTPDLIQLVNGYILTNEEKQNLIHQIQKVVTENELLREMNTRLTNSIIVASEKISNKIDEVGDLVTQEGNRITDVVVHEGNRITDEVAYQGNATREAMSANFNDIKTQMNQTKDEVMNLLRGIKEDMRNNPVSLVQTQGIITKIYNILKLCFLYWWQFTVFLHKKYWELGEYLFVFLPRLISITHTIWYILEFCLSTRVYIQFIILILSFGYLPHAGDWLHDLGYKVLTFILTFLINTFVTILSDNTITVFFANIFKEIWEWITSRFPVILTLISLIVDPATYLYNTNMNQYIPDLMTLLQRLWQQILDSSVASVTSKLTFWGGEPQLRNKNDINKKSSLNTPVLSIEEINKLQNDLNIFMKQVKNTFNDTNEENIELKKYIKLDEKQISILNVIIEICIALPEIIVKITEIVIDNVEKQIKLKKSAGSRRRKYKVNQSKKSAGSRRRKYKVNRSKKSAGSRRRKYKVNRSKKSSGSRRRKYKVNRSKRIMIE